MTRIISLLLFLILVAGSFWASGDGPDYVARNLDLELPQPLSVCSEDSHGGFHGDGLLHIELTFSSEDGALVADAVSHHPNGRWNCFPMDQEMEDYLWGGGAGMAGWPLPENGWWYLKDRQEGRPEACYQGSMFERASHNYTLAIYNADTCTLYYLELDT